VTGWPVLARTAVKPGSHFVIKPEVTPMIRRESGRVNTRLSAGNAGLRRGS